MNIGNTQTYGTIEAGNAYTPPQPNTLLKELVTRGYASFKWSSTSHALLNFFTSLGLENIPTTKGVISENRLQEKTLYNWNSNTNDFYFHQDGSHLPTKPKFVALHCLEPGKRNIPTVITNARKIYQELQKEFDHGTLHSLQAVYINSKFEIFKRPLIEASDSGAFLNAFHYVEPDPLALTQDIRVKLNQTLPVLLQRIIELQETHTLYVHTWKQNDVLIFDNQQFHHARVNKENKEDPQRHLRRMWFANYHDTHNRLI